MNDDRLVLVYFDCQASIFFVLPLEIFFRYLVLGMCNDSLCGNIEIKSLLF